MVLFMVPINDIFHSPSFPSRSPPLQRNQISYQLRPAGSREKKKPISQPYSAIEFYDTIGAWGLIRNSAMKRLDRQDIIRQSNPPPLTPLL
jgi:hypothetical protein